MNSRAKGASAERELARVIHEHLGVRMVRNLEQYRQGGHDLVPHPDETGPVAAALARYAIEAKRYARGKAAPHERLVDRSLRPG
jgi:Holliday junction resolvase